MQLFPQAPARRAGVVAVAAAILVGPLAGAGSAASEVTSSSVLAPPAVAAGRTALYSATWVNHGNATLANPVVVVTLPAGSAVESAIPAGCAAPEPAAPTDPLVVSCEHANLPAETAVTQLLLVRVPAVAVRTEASVTAVLRADEQASDRERSHADTFPAPTQSFTILPAGGDETGGCLRDGEAGLATRAGLDAANPLITTAELAGPSGVVCVPVTVAERPGTSPTEACGAGATCTTDIAVTEYFPATLPPPAAPIRLTFTVVASSKNMTWYKNGEPVAECRGATDLPAGLNACVTSRAKVGAMAVRLGVLWRAGPDPDWRG